jgi:hypothetical protein
LKTYDESLAVLRRSLDQAKLGHSDKIDGFKRLDNLVRTVERQYAVEARFDEAIQHEFAISESVGGRSVFDDKEAKRADGRKQLSLFVEG